MMFGEAGFTGGAEYNEYAASGYKNYNIVEG
jgi:hypothetical protein